MLCQTCAPCDMTHPCHTWGSLPHWAVWWVSQNVITSCSTVPLIIWYHRSEIVMSWMIKFSSNKNVSKCQTRSNTLTQKPTPANPCPVSCFVPEMWDIHQFQSNPLQSLLLPQDASRLCTRLPGYRYGISQYLKCAHQTVYIVVLHVYMIHCTLCSCEH